MPYINLWNPFLSTWSRKECGAGIFFDLTKVFDCVNHELLIHKLQYYGVRGVTLNWFRSCQFEREQRVKMKLISTSDKLQYYGIRGVTLD